GGRPTVLAEPFPRPRHHSLGAAGIVAAADCKIDFFATVDSGGKEVRGDRRTLADWSTDGTAAPGLGAGGVAARRAGSGDRDALLASADKRSGAGVAQGRGCRCSSWKRAIHTPSKSKPPCARYANWERSNTPSGRGHICFVTKAASARRNGCSRR